MANQRKGDGRGSTSSRFDRSDAELVDLEPTYDLPCTILESSWDLITVIDPNGVIVFENPAVSRVLGYAQEARYGRTILDQVPDDYRSLADRFFTHVPATGATRIAVFPVRDAHGAFRQLEIAIAKCTDGAYAGNSVLTCRDATDRIHAAESLAESEERYHELFNHSPAAILVITADLVVAEVNAAMSRLIDRPIERIVGEPFESLLIPDSRDEFTRLWPDLISGTRVPAIDLRMVADDGTRRTALLHGGPHHRVVRDGRCALVTLSLLDVTALRAAQQREHEHREELYQAAKLVSLGTLVAGVAHEINNPNNYIRISAENLGLLWANAESLLERQASTDASLALGGIPFDRANTMVRSAIDAVLQGADRIARLVSDLTDYARKTDETSYEEVDLRDVLSSATTIIGATIRQHTGRFSMDLPPLPIPIRCRPQQVEQVIINLVSNACQALTSREEAVSVRIASTPDEPWIELVVEDEGRGMTAEVLSQLTDPFFTTRRGSGGTGLGLAVSHRIVADHGGVIRFESTPGAGTRAIVRLPERARDITSNSGRKHG